MLPVGYFYFKFIVMFTVLLGVINWV